MLSSRPDDFTRHSLSAAKSGVPTIRIMDSHGINIAI